MYKDFWKNKNRFDNNDYPETNQVYDKTNQKVNNFKGEPNTSQIIKEFIGLRVKCIHIKDNNKNSETAKGVKNVVFKKAIKHGDCKNTLFNKKQMS